MTSVSYCKNPKDQNSLNPAEQKSLSWADPPPKLPGCNASSPRGDVSGVAGTVPTVICLGRKVSQAQNRPLSWRWRIGMSGFIPEPDPQKGERETEPCVHPSKTLHVPRQLVTSAQEQHGLRRPLGSRAGQGRELGGHTSLPRRCTAGFPCTSSRSRG